MDDHQADSRLTDDELRRQSAREKIAARLSPGCRVFVVKRLVVNDSARDQREYTLHKLALWRDPSPTGPLMARDWRVRKKDPTWRNALEAHKGPVLHVGERATVIALLPKVDCPTYGTRPWALLLSDDGMLGWCYALDGLEILAPAGGA